jgi:hypothetical protein
MKTQQINALYAALTTKERARLAFLCASHGDTTEVDRISAGVEQVRYRGPDIEYLRWLVAFHDLAQRWAIEHWRLQSRASVAVGGANVYVSDKALGPATLFLDIHEQMEERLVALDRALDAVCAEHGIDADAIRSLAETQRFSPHRAGPDGDAEYEAMMLERFRSLLPSE